eukprot:scaffold89781_cov69-Phaeocystis_antarctica.AAC.4
MENNPTPGYTVAVRLPARESQTKPSRRINRRAILGHSSGATRGARTAAARQEFSAARIALCSEVRPPAAGTRLGHGRRWSGIGAARRYGWRRHARPAATRSIQRRRPRRCQPSLAPAAWAVHRGVRAAGTSGAAATRCCTAAAHLLAMPSPGRAELSSTGRPRPVVRSALVSSKGGFRP